MPDTRKIGDLQYFLYDGRAMYDIDRAFVLEICYTEEKARKAAEGYGEAVCYVYVWDGEYATNEKFLWHYLYGADPEFSDGGV